MSSESGAYIPALGLGLVAVALLRPVLCLIVAEGHTPPRGRAWGPVAARTAGSGRMGLPELPAGPAWMAAGAPWGPAAAGVPGGWTPPRQLEGRRRLAAAQLGPVHDDDWSAVAARVSM